MRGPPKKGKAALGWAADLLILRKPYDDAGREQVSRSRMVRGVIENYLPPDQLKILKVAEESERELIAGLVDRIGGGSP